MAIIEVTGIVKKVYSSSFSVGEKVQIPGYDFEKIYTVWTKNSPTIGSTVFVRGKLSMKSKTYGESGQSYIDVSINEPVVTVLKKEKSTTDEQQQNGFVDGFQVSAEDKEIKTSE